MNNIFKHVTICIVAMSVFFTTLCCMDMPENKNRVSIPSCIVAKVLSVILTKKLDLSDHHMLCSLGINKACEKVLLDTAPARKEYFMERLRGSLLPNCEQGAIWHKYGSAFGRKRGPVNSRDGLICVQDEFYCHGNKCNSYESSAFVKDAQGALDFIRPKFDEQGYFYSYRLTQYRHPNAIVEYRFSRSIPCRLLLEKNDFNECFIEMVPFAAFPNLLKVFLNNLEVHVDGTFKFCNVEKIIIPNNYKECIPEDEYKSYNDLPDWWREVIDKCYNEQPKK